MNVHWHRRDLRAADNSALANAASFGPVLPVFVFDRQILQHGSSVRVAYMLDALSSLGKWYHEHGSTLLVTRGDPREVLPALAEAIDAENVLWNKDYSGLARERDADVRQALAEQGVRRASYHDEICHEPGSITTNDGDPYSVFTYFGRKWQDREKEEPHDAPDADKLVDPTGLSVPDRWSSTLPTLDDLGFDEPDATLQPASTDAARERLESFCAEDIYRYDDRRDYPADGCTSQLSADLKWGTIGIREVHAATVEAAERADTEDERESVEEFQSQLAWREFYTHVLFFNPEVVTENYKEYENSIEWREEPEHLSAWKTGETGYPIVDAGMRQLLSEGYMHNRVRMIVASFLTKDLMLDWREGYDWFRERLADHDTANDNGGWQWAASTGTDSQPYFRIFNPMTQGERYDPDAEYIKRYVPELADVEPEQIHSWHELSETQRRRLAPEYHAPIVDHSERREAAIEMFEAARGE
ncbi:cryptochrome/photolyase family protein [Natranaeroarchaeum sulfidigenes]|uniref:Deoxyribodipyrimidine photolyase n=1 Tax=Natranaeroarchaeum sulfidigenes TaxID=2784880 RepID=A0A897MKH0_9EURY|nr:deoxyribodipyrimidine photo-lyase [Natranaeroarchaeum sulfidigenes]QSG02610.1 Deoxyribodipyrimidine photolyase [Natranaeroarchaeum sulfidigenes]